MNNVFFKIGKFTGPRLRKAKWLYQSITGNEQDIIKIESEVGRDMVGEFKRQVEIDNDNEVLNLLDSIGKNLTASLKNKERKFSFTSITNTAPNAFALPGGYIFISRNLMELCHWNKNEIASALAHEMGHIIYKHSVNRILTNSAISIGIGGINLNGIFAKWLKNAGIKSLECAYSRENEFEADSFAVRLASAAGYQPMASVDLFKRLDNLSTADKKNCLGQYFSTHPDFHARIENLKKQISKLQSSR